MAYTILQGSVDPGSLAFGRSYTWTDAELDADYILDVRGTLGRDAITTRIEVGAADALTIRINSYRRLYPLDPIEKLYGLGIKDLTTYGEHIDLTAPSFTIEVGEILTLTDPIANIEIVSISATDGITIMVR